MALAIADSYTSATHVSRTHPVHHVSQHLWPAVDAEVGTEPYDDDVVWSRDVDELPEVAARQEAAVALGVHPPPVLV
jgi:hypothetical protein